MSIASSLLWRPDLEGDAFFWHGGPVGIALFHGYTATTAEIRPLAQYLHERGYTVAGPLLPGHGLTPQDLNRQRWRDWARAAEDAYRQVAARCQRVFIAGESMGALLALYLASEHPEAVGLLVYAPAVRLRLALWQRLLLRLAAPFRLAVPKASLDPDGLWQGYRVTPLKGTLQLLALQAEVRRRMPRISQPLLIAQGRLDRSVDPAGAEETYASVRSSVKELHWYDRSGHCVILDVERTAVAERSVAFIERTALISGWAQAPVRVAPLGTQDALL